MSGLTNIFDETIMQFIQTYLPSDFMDHFFLFFTRLGDGGLIWIALTIALLLHPKTRRCGALMAVSLALAALVGNKIIKPVVERPRPCMLYPEIQLLIPRPDSFSFPSGHTISSFAAASALFFQKNGWFTAAGLLAALLIGLSRIYLFVHWPTDVLAGMVLGIVTTIILAYSVPFFRSTNTR